MLVVEAETPGLDSVSDITVQHPDSANFGFEGDADTTDRVVGGGRDLTSAASAVTVGVNEVIPRGGVRIIVIDVSTCPRVIILHKVGIVFLHTIVQDSDHDVFARDAHLPGLLDIHVKHAPSVGVPHQWVSGVIKIHRVVKGCVRINGWGLLLRHPPRLLLIEQTSPHLTKLASPSTAPITPLTSSATLDHLLLGLRHVLVLLDGLVRLLMAVH